MSFASNKEHTVNDLELSKKWCLWLPIVLIGSAWTLLLQLIDKLPSSPSSHFHAALFLTAALFFLIANLTVGQRPPLPFLKTATQDTAFTIWLCFLVLGFSCIPVAISCLLFEWKTASGFGLVLIVVLGIIAFKSKSDLKTSLLKTNDKPS